MKKLYNTEEKIIKWLNRHHVLNYTLVEDTDYGFVVNVAGDVNLLGKKLKEIAVKFNCVTGNFLCNYNSLIRLRGSPLSVGGVFDCSSNYLESLEDAPKSVGSSDCNNNQITSLHSPLDVVSDFICYDNAIESLHGVPFVVWGKFWCYRNKLTTLNGGPRTVAGDFICNHNLLTSYMIKNSLEITLALVQKEFLTSGAPLSVGGSFACSDNQIDSLENFSEIVRGAVHMGDNKKHMQHQDVMYFADILPVIEQEKLVNLIDAKKSNKVNKL